MKALLKEIRHNPLLWLLVFVPVVLLAAKVKHDAHTLLFVLSVLAIVPLAALLSHATEPMAAKTGDPVGGLINDHAWAADKADDFSQRIRAGVPGIAP
jgi:Ca2+:H+ antiporter